MSVAVHDTALPDVKVLEPRVLGDERGFFFESFNARDFAAAVDRQVTFVQDNHSRSATGVLRGLHYQLPPHAQGKLVRCSRGIVWDVAVDIRRGSPTFATWVGIELSAENKRQVWIPEGFAHGFVALTEGAEVLYKTTDHYAPECDRGIAWDDPVIGIEWPLAAAPVVSDKDAQAPMLAAAEIFEGMAG